MSDVHDRCLVDSGDVWSSVLGGIFEGVSGNSLRSLVSDKLDGLNDTRDNLQKIIVRSCDCIAWRWFSPRAQYLSTLLQCSHE